MRIIRCEKCNREEPVEEATGWLQLMQDGGASMWDFCSVRCLATWSNEAV